jgi:hypothetical protein
VSGITKEMALSEIFLEIPTKTNAKMKPVHPPKIKIPKAAITALPDLEITISHMIGLIQFMQNTIFG